MLDYRVRKIFEVLFNELNDFILQSNKDAQALGAFPLPHQKIQIVGQTALLLKELPFSITATMDLDLNLPVDHKVQKKLDDLLMAHGMQLESDGHLIWMPPDTTYEKILDYPTLSVFIADPDSVIASKFKFKRIKDQKLIQTYLEYFPDRKEIIKTKAGQ